MNMGMRPADRPNMTPMIDVVFLLLIFFLVTMKFKSLDMRIEADMPKNRGLARFPIDTPPPPKLVATLRPADDGARVLLSNREIGRTTDPHVWNRFAEFARGALERHAENGGDISDFEAEIDTVGAVATGDVVRTIDAFTEAHFEKITFRGTSAPGARTAATPPR